MPPERDVEVADTLEPEAGAGRAAASAGPPLVDWDRYELGELLGRGGMGAVYRARDPRLDRMVAIKLILGADPNLRMRFVREARAQARIDHPNICRVYEAGEVQGRAYIALQLIAGEPLDKAAANMALDQKIAVLRDVALAVHEAHRHGIVHRDLKPANVLVERTEDGRWLPFVMDFGLAREATVEAGITESGVPLGTPAYMSPEQARGDVHAVDRRSDVYSLGATLYQLLTGSVPFPTTSLALALARVIHDDPPPPRSRVPSLPIDLETIALKCLAKDPNQRYPSARALADDLGRYLDGEPILGRRLSLWQRARLRARRHRAVVVLGAWSLAVIVVVASLGVRAWLVSRSERALTADRTRLAERLGREAKDIELSLRMAYQLPLHDTRSDRERVHAKMRTIAATRHDLGALGDAIIHDALGRGHLALHEWREAADELARAADAGPQTPEQHVARGRALGELYYRALAETRVVHAKEMLIFDDKAWLARKTRELEQRYLAPALDELEQGRASGEDAELLEALFALYRNELAVAEQRALVVAERSPGLSEARKLAADAAYGAAVEVFDHGDYATARVGLERAIALYEAASEVARSDASLYDAAAQAWLQRAQVDFRQHRDPGESIDRALAVIDERALHAAPDDATAYLTKSYVLQTLLRIQTSSAVDDKRPLLDRIAEAAERATELEPVNAHAWTSLANAHIARGNYELFHDGKGAPWWNRALDEVGKALTLQPDHLRANNTLGVVHRWFGTDIARAGGDPRGEYKLALHGYERAGEIDPQYLFACSNETDLHTVVAEYDDSIGNDPRPSVENARRSGQRCLEINPTYYAPLDNLAQAYLALTHYLVEHGGDPTAALASARGYLDRAEAAQPETGVLWYHRGVAASTEAAFRLTQGADPTSAITESRVALRKSLALLPNAALTYVETSRLELADAAWATRGKRDPGPALARARADAENAITLDKQLATARLTAAEACLAIAKHAPSPAVIQSGLDHVNSALQLGPQLVKAKSVRAELLYLRGP